MSKFYFQIYIKYILSFFLTTKMRRFPVLDRRRIGRRLLFGRWHVAKHFFESQGNDEPARHRRRRPSQLPPELPAVRSALVLVCRRSGLGRTSRSRLLGSEGSVGLQGIGLRVGPSRRRRRRLRRRSLRQLRSLLAPFERICTVRCHDDRVSSFNTDKLCTTR